LASALPIWIFQFSDFQTQGTKHIAFGVDDIEALFKRFRTEGVDIVFGPVESPPKDALFGGLS
jgi:catechol 2,3-dioxygenase-like lactoylglutathione lyase family enzyme